MIHGSKLQMAVYVGRYGAIAHELEGSKMACWGVNHLAAFQIIYNRAVSADIDCHLEFGALYHMTARDSPHILAPHNMACISVDIGIDQPNNSDTCNSYMLHNHQIMAANHSTELSNSDILSFSLLLTEVLTIFTTRRLAPYLPTTLSTSLTHTRPQLHPPPPHPPQLPSSLTIP